MSFRDDYLRVKDRWKRKLGVGATNASSTSVGQVTRAGRSPSPIPEPLAQTQPQTGDNTSNIIKSSSSYPSLHESATFERTKLMTSSRLKTLLQIIESGSEVFPPLKSAVGGLNRFIEIFETASQGHKEFEELIATLMSLLEYTRMYVNRANPRMTNSVKNLWIGLDNELKIVEGKYNRGEIKRLVEALDDVEEIVKCHRRIHGHLERLTLNANLSMWETANESATETRLQRLSPALSAVYNSAESEKIKRRECTLGTRKNELDKLLGWARNSSPEAEDIYWMNGMAGTGKTTIACSLCAELEKSSELGASFFCSRQIPECRDVSLIIPCISYQLARFSLPYRHALSNVLETDPDVHTRVLQTQFDSLLAKPLIQVKHTLPTDFVVVIDALDECESEDSVGQILDLLLSHTAHLDLPVRFLLSSRPESKIYQKMMARVGHSFSARLVLHDLDAETVKLDIRTYLEAELAAISPTSAQLTKLVELSGVLFIFASTAARYIIEGQELMEHEDRLRMVLGFSAESTDDKNESIDQLYTSILRVVFEKKNLKQARTRLKVLLDTIICTQEPMTVDGLAGLLGEKSGKHVEVLLRQLSSVLNIAESTGLVTTLHTSFPDYMLDRRRSAAFHCHSQTTHLQMSRACFEAIKSQDPQFNICEFESSYLCDDQDPTLEERASTIVSSHLLYACRYWVTHLEFGDQLGESQSQLWDFLSTRLLLWMEVLNIRDRIHLAPIVTSQAETWSKITGCSNETSELAHDAWRFATMFAGHAVSQSTPHIYVSMLPFWPGSSPISRHYLTQMRRRASPKLQGTAMTQRQLALLTTWTFDSIVDAVRFSPNGSLTAVGLASSVYVIDSITGQTTLGPLTHDDVVRTIAFSVNGLLLATGSEDWSIRMWSMIDGELVWQVLEAHTGYVLSLSFLPDGARLVSGGNDGSLRVWDVGTSDLILDPTHGHAGAIMSVSVSPDGTRIASGSVDNTIRVWDAQTGDTIMGPLEGHTNRIDSVCFSPDGMRLASGSWDGTLRVWGNLFGPVTVEWLQGHIDYVTAVAFSPDGRYIASGSRDYTLRIWGGEANLECVAVLRGHMNTVLSVAFSLDSTRIVSGSHDRTVRVWDAQGYNAASVLPFRGHTKSVTSVSFSHDGRYIVSGSNDSTLCVWDTRDGQLAVDPFMGHTDWVLSACFSPDSTQIVSCSTDKTLRLWDTYSGSLIDEPVNGHTGEIWSVCFSPDGDLVASSSADHTIRLWNTRTHEPIGSPLEGHTDTVRSVCFSPDGSRLVSGSLDESVMVWDVESRQQVYSPLQGHTNGITSVHISPDGARIASGSWDTTVRLWDIRNGDALSIPLQGHSAEVAQVQFSPDSRYVVSCSVDKSLRIWNAHTGDAVGTPLLGHTEEVRCCSFSPCGKWVVSGANDNAIRIWDVSDLVEAQGSKEIHRHDDQSIVNLSASASWHLQGDGWVVDTQSRHLAWVPPDLRHVLMSPRNTLLISTNGSFQLEFDHGKLGENWAGNYAA